MPYGDLVLPLIFGPVILVALVYTVRAALGWATVTREAREDFAYRQSNGMVPHGVDADTYGETYRRVNGPRGATHVAVALWGVLLATPLIAKALEVSLEMLWQASGQSRVFEPGYLVWAFFIFFGLMGAWALICGAVAQHYHRNAPLRFEDELKARAAAP